MKHFSLFSLLFLSVLAHGQITLPIDFQSTSISYNFVDFGGGQMSQVDNPDMSGINTSSKVARMIKNAGDPWGGSFLELAGPIDFSTNKHFKLKVWTPGAGRKVLFKVENPTNGGIFYEQEKLTTVGNAWEELVFDFTAVNTANTYQKLVFIFDLGTVGNGSSNFTFYVDDIEQFNGGGGKAQVDLPITFQDTATVDYKLTDFGGNASSIVQDPTDPNNLVGKAIKTAGAELWAGTTNGGSGLANPIPFTAANTKMSVRVWSPDAGTPIRLKAENAANGAISVETETNTTVAGQWEVLEFNFNNPAPNTPALNTANTYNKVSIFFNFGTPGAVAGEKTYYWDDVKFIGGGGSGLAQVNLPITFQDTATVAYSLVDFGGNVSSIVQDPTNPANLVGKAIKTAGAELWAGTTNGGSGLATPIPFTASSTKMTVRVWSPDAGTPIRLKAENATNGAISVETETNTTVAGQWETLVFNFSNQAPGTAALNLANSYNKISIFFNFGTNGATAGEKTYYWDDVRFGLAQVSLPITFEDTASVNYALTDFGGNVSSIVQDPTNPENLVGKAIKTAGAELWAGTTNGGSGLATAVPFSSGNTKMTVRVWSPDAGTPIRLKVENASNPAISVETEAVTTVAGAWQTLEFNFSNQAPGTAALNLANIYNKVSIFFNFGTTGAAAGEKTYYWDDIRFGGLVNTSNPELDAVNIQVFPNPASDFCTIAFAEFLTEPVQLSVLDANGRLLKSAFVTDQQSVLPLQELHNGLYYLKLEKGGKNYFRKLMVVK